MINDLLQAISSTVTIERFFLATCQNEINALLRISGNNKNFELVCRNAHGISLDDISAPFQISGFEIRDNSELGYQADSRYTVCDYEDGAISFYCEEIEVTEIITETDIKTEIEQI